MHRLVALKSGDTSASVTESSGYAKLITDAIRKAGLNVEQTKLLYGNVIISGGNTLLPGFTERLTADVYSRLNAIHANLGSKLSVVSNIALTVAVSRF